MLRLQAESGVFRIGIPCGSFDASIREIGAVDLHARLSGVYFHRASRFGIFELSAKRKCAWTLSIHYQAVVIATAEFGLANLSNLFANRVRGSKIQRTSSDGGKLASRDQSVICQQV